MLKRHAKAGEEALSDTATSKAAAIAVAASSGANFRESADSKQLQHLAEARASASGTTGVSRSFLDPLGVFEKVGIAFDAPPKTGGILHAVIEVHPVA